MVNKSSKQMHVDHDGEVGSACIQKPSGEGFYYCRYTVLKSKNSFAFGILRVEKGNCVISMAVILGFSNSIFYVGICII